MCLKYFDKMAQFLWSEIVTVGLIENNEYLQGIVTKEPEWEIAWKQNPAFQCDSLEIRFGKLNGEESVCGTFPPICNIGSVPF